MSNMLKKVFIFITSCGLPAGVPLGTILGSLVAFPLLALFNIAYYASHAVCWWSLVVLAVAVVIALYGTLSVTDEPYTLASDKALGLIIALVRIPFTVKFLIIGFALFHALRVAVPFLSRRLLGFEIHQWGLLLGVLLPSLIAGIGVNLFLHLVIWFGR